MKCQRHTTNNKNIGVCLKYCLYGCPWTRIKNQRKKLENKYLINYIKNDYT